MRENVWPDDCRISENQCFVFLALDEISEWGSVERASESGNPRTIGLVSTIDVRNWPVPLFQAYDCGASMRYTASAVAVLQDEKAREFLITQGLPSKHLLFDAYDPGSVQVVTGQGGREVLCIGEVGENESLCLDIENGEVVSFYGTSGRIWHLNADVLKFAELLDVFTARYPFYEVGSEPEIQEGAADSFREILLQIDATALSEDPGYWHYILHDIAIGDYSDE